MAAAPAEAPAAPPQPAATVADDLWQRACAELVATVSPAAYQAWIAPLWPAPDQPEVPEQPAGEVAGAAPMHLVCATTFQRDQIERRYRRLIEAALGRSIVLVVGPSGTACSPNREQ